MELNHLAELTWQEYRERIKNGFLILPVGATEQHAPHLPLGVDAIIADGLAESISKKTGGLIAPVISYGYKSQASSGGGPLFPGTIDMRGKTMIDVMKDLLKEFIADGWRKIFVMNGHFENLPFINEACDELTRYGSFGNSKILVSSWWDNISPNVMRAVFDEVDFPGWELEHAAIAETSMMLHFREDLVRVDRIVDEGMESLPTYQIFPPPETLVKRSGSLHTAVSSSKEKGELLVKDITANIVQFLSAEFPPA